MKQILIAKNSQIKELAGSRIEFYLNKDQHVIVSDESLVKIEIPFKAKIMSGGTLDLDFSVPQNLASRGVSLLGAYWDGKMITAYMRAMPLMAVGLNNEEPVLVGTLVQVVTYRQINDMMLNASVDAEKSGDVLVVSEKPKRKGGRRKKTDVR